jgi:hypothetical protein
MGYKAYKFFKYCGIDTICAPNNGKWNVQSIGKWLNEYNDSIVESGDILEISDSETMLIDRAEFPFYDRIGQVLAFKNNKSFAVVTIKEHAEYLKENAPFIICSTEY